MNSKIENPATTWAAILVDEMLRVGVSAVVIAPGSRSTPLALAFAAQNEIKVYSLLDERSAAFFALGLALESGRPAAVLCTSGTAAANFYPAVIEASQAHVPILLLTADRPPELRSTGANQTIDQVGMFGKYVRFEMDLLPPVAQAPELLHRYLRTTVDRAIAAGLAPVPGPVHLNIPFRKPLEPAAGQPTHPKLESRRREKVFTQIIQPQPQVEVPVVEWPARGLIIAGPRTPQGAFPDALADLSRKTGYPVVADGLSGLRFGPWTSGMSIFNPQIGRAFIEGRVPMPELVLQFGAVPTANALTDLLAALPGDCPRISVQPFGTWHDDTHLLSHLLHAEPTAFCQTLAARWDGPEPDAEWNSQIQAAEGAYWQALNEVAAGEDFEGLLLQDVVDSLPDNSLLFVANSLPVRHLDEFVRTSEKRVRVFCNRGASGIDGTISTALGVAASSDRPLTLVLGDLAFYHDLNGLLAFKRCGAAATLVLLHNDGGGIFRRLPISHLDPPFEDLFRTPHGLDFEPAARMFGWHFGRPQDRSAFRQAVRAATRDGQPHIIEMRTSSEEHEAARREVLAGWSEILKNPAVGVETGA